MAKLEIASTLVEELLFPGSLAEIKGVSYSPERRALIFEIEGQDVPDAEEVIAVYQRKRISVEFMDAK